MLSGHVVAFPAIVSSFQDQYTSNWNEENIYGRMDPLMVFQNTQRQITMDWSVVAYSGEEARTNYIKFKQLSRLLYPTYSEENGVFTMAGAPLLRVKFTNLVQGETIVGANGGGLLCAVNGFSFNPVMEDGWAEMGSPGSVFSKNYNVSTTLKVLHEHQLGYHDASNKWLGAADFNLANFTKEEMQSEKFAPARKAVQAQAEKFKNHSLTRGFASMLGSFGGSTETEKKVKATSMKKILKGKKGKPGGKPKSEGKGRK